jgi:hypothetical protein
MDRVQVYLLCHRHTELSSPVSLCITLWGICGNIPPKIVFNLQGAMFKWHIFSLVFQTSHLVLSQAVAQPCQ